ncbi:threonylcarbamoyl-AMP synthase [Vibrio zhanjiangensis]|uniref:Threonylcarbamoyl-AMP synthase n=1 Tax=Vibrio zhanjiangensis TaxID=1046128 RepID=A0ABQ6F4S4_9VIBR|nr:L-threonylcarbamoyladenylate synthase [Vibrio zhanjiangensis]GLT20244.1 threonylcarbamoyl-AMP synthase [Vibrio zhanjiangensis]
MDNFEQVLLALNNGEVIAYPTEGVFGVGCDPDNPDAIKKLLELKKRPVEKGLILIAASYEQLLPYIDESQLSEAQLNRVHQTWPGPVTWIMPCSHKASKWVSGQFDSIAVRVTDHPLVQKMCFAFGKPLTSTSANLTGKPPCKTTQEVEHQLGDRLAAILAGETGGRDKPSEIRDAKTSKVLRQG